MDHKLIEFWSNAATYTSEKFSWIDLHSIIRNMNEDYITIPLSYIPIERDQTFEIAALSPRDEHFYYLLGDYPLQNISKYSTGTKIGINRSQIEMVIEEFNPGISCHLNDRNLPIQIKLLSDQELKNSQFKYQERLSEIEFIPPTSVGIMAAVCRTEDFDTRKYLYQFHHEISKDIANIERGIIKYARENHRPEPIQVYTSYKDGNFSCALFFNKKNELHFEQYYQTSILDFATNFYNKIYI